MKREYKIITSVIPNSTIDAEFLKALHLYRKHLKADLHIYNTSLSKKEAILQANEIEDYRTFKDLKINDSLIVKNINIRHTVVNPLTQLGFFNKCVIVPAPRLTWQTLPKQNKSQKLPRAVYTTGTISNAENYKHTKADILAQELHQKNGKGFIIIEVINNKEFLARQVDWDSKNKCFYDTLDNKKIVKVTSTKITGSKASNLSLGDLHHWDLAQDAWEWTEELIASTKPEFVQLHDAVDGSAWYVNHHIQNKQITREKSTHDIKEELTAFNDFIIKTAKKFSFAKFEIIASNHNEFFDRFAEDESRLNGILDEYKKAIVSQDFKKIELAKNTLDVLSELLGYVKNSKNPLKEYFENRNGTSYKSVLWRNRSDSRIFKKMELLNHGDKGANGSLGSPLQFNRVAPGQTITGHTHSPMRTVWGNFINGTLSNLNPDYCDPSGFSSWLHCHTIQFENGKCQSLVFIK